MADQAFQIVRFSKEGTSGSLHLGVAQLGGKGASLVNMTALGLPVPPGFIIPIVVWKAWRALTPKFREELVDKLMDEVYEHVAWLADQFGYRPLLSVRSGAPISMPGMMETVLNVGLMMDNIDWWAGKIGEIPSRDCYRRLVQMVGTTCYEIEDNKFMKPEPALMDTLLKWDMLVDGHKKVFEQNTDMEWADDWGSNLRDAIEAVFRSWDSLRAIEYRKLNKIPDDMGTAVVIQAMVFGNTGEHSGSGVLFTRDPSTGENKVMAEYLPNAQGEDVVAGTHTPQKLDLSGYIAPTASDGDKAWTVWQAKLQAVCEKLEKHYRDMVDVEFTVQENQLFILQSRVGKRSALAAFRIAVDLVSEGVITIDEALCRLTVEQYKAVRRPTVDPSYDEPPTMVGTPTSPGVASGVPAWSSQIAASCTEPCVLVTSETTPEDIVGMAKAAGILTETGGATCHAAVVARAMEKPCVVGCSDLNFEHHLHQMWKKVTIDGSTGRVWVNKDVPLVDCSKLPEVERVIGWCLAHKDYAVMTTFPILDGKLPHRVMAAHWWDDEDALDLVLDDLKKIRDEHGTLEHVTLDCRIPCGFTEKADDTLLMSFGSLGNQEKFAAVMADELVKSELGGAHLRVENLDLSLPGPVTKALQDAGFVIAGKKPQTLADVLFGGAATPDSEFIENIIGGQHAWAKLQEMLKSQGIEVQAGMLAVPADYAAFAVLGGHG